MKSPWFSLNHISHLATVEIRVVRLGSFQNLYLSFAIVEITHGVTANRDDIYYYYYFIYLNSSRETFNLGLVSSVGRAAACQSGGRRLKSCSSKFFFVHPKIFRKCTQSVSLVVYYMIFIYLLIFSFLYFSFFWGRGADLAPNHKCFGECLHVHIYTAPTLYTVYIVYHIYIRQNTHYLKISSDHEGEIIPSWIFLYT